MEYYLWSDFIGLSWWTAENSEIFPIWIIEQADLRIKYIIKVGLAGKTAQEI